MGRACERDLLEDRPYHGSGIQALAACIICCRKGGLESRCKKHGREVFAELVKRTRYLFVIIDISSAHAGASARLRRRLMGAALLGIWASRLMRSRQSWEDPRLL